MTQGVQDESSLAEALLQGGQMMFFKVGKDSESGTQPPHMVKTGSRSSFQ